MMPPYAQIIVSPIERAGIFPIRTFGLVGIHDPAKTGIQAPGVGTPSAADVADITVGFTGLVHIPNGGILTKGTESSIVPIGLCPAKTPDFGIQTREAGDNPNEQEHIPPVTALNTRFSQCSLLKIATGTATKGMEYQESSEAEIQMSKNTFLPLQP
jgi:hypothetical protein